MQRSGPTAIALGLTTLSAALAITGALSAPDYFSNRGALFYLVQLGTMLLLYAAAAYFQNRLAWDTATGLWFGIATGMTEVLVVAIENGLPPGLYIPVPAGVVTPAIFAAWGAAGFVAARRNRSWRGGLVTSIAASMVCMLIGVTGGMFLELILAPSPPAVVATWQEFKRSGWRDPSAFRVANTLDSAFVHLLFAPFIAAIAGGGAAALARVFRDSAEY